MIPGHLLFCDNAINTNNASCYHRSKNMFDPLLFRASVSTTSQHVIVYSWGTLRQTSDSTSNTSKKLLSNTTKWGCIVKTAVFYELGVSMVCLYTSNDTRCHRVWLQISNFPALVWFFQAAGFRLGGCAFPGLNHFGKRINNHSSWDIDYLMLLCFRVFISPRQKSWSPSSQTIRKCKDSWLSVLHVSE